MRLSVVQRQVLNWVANEVGADPGPVSIRRCGAACGLSDQRTHAVLHSLVQAGCLVLVKQGRSSAGGRRGRARVMAVVG